MQNFWRAISALDSFSRFYPLTIPYPLPPLKPNKETKFVGEGGGGRNSLNRKVPALFVCSICLSPFHAVRVEEG